MPRLKEASKPDEVPPAGDQFEGDPSTAPVADAPTPVAPTSIIAALERHGHMLIATGQHVSHGLVSDVAVAAGTLKQKTAAAHGKLGGEIGQLVDRLHSIL